MKKRITGKVVAIVLAAITVFSCGFAVMAATMSGESVMEQELGGGKSVRDYSGNKPVVTGEKVQLKEMELAEKEWFEYVEYVYDRAEEVEENGVKYIYRFYAPKDYAEGAIMAIRDYNPDKISGTGSALGSMWDDMAPLFATIGYANISVIASGGATVGIVSLITQEAIAIGAQFLFANAAKVIENAPYYSRPEFMGISGTEWNGISNTGFYMADSITIQMDSATSISIAKTNTISSDYGVSGELSTNAGGKILGFGVEVDAKSGASSSLGYGLDFQQGQSVDNSVSVSRTFSARTDPEVANVGWKLCEYIVRVPYRVDIYRVTGGEEQLVDPIYINYDLLQGVCRVFANGYIEHWNTGKLVSYADFFKGFLTEEQLVAGAKAKETE